MAKTIFNTRKAFEKFERAGVAPEAASAHVEVLEEITEGLVTREYLDVRLEALEHRISDKLTLRFGLMLTGAVAVLTFVEQVVFK